MCLYATLSKILSEKSKTQNYTAISIKKEKYKN